MFVNCRSSLDRSFSGTELLLVRFGAAFAGVAQVSSEC